MISSGFARGKTKKLCIDVQFTGSRAKQQQGTISTAQKLEETTDVIFEGKKHQ